MTIRQINSPCFTLEPNPWGDTEASIQHFPTFTDADEELARLRGERRADDRTRVKKEAAVCWVAECDDCGELFIDDNAGGSHFGKVEGDLEDYLRWDGWTRTAPDGCRCWLCSPGRGAAVLVSC